MKLTILVCLFLLSGACTKDKENQKKLSDAQVSKVITTVNDGEIELARYVLGRSLNEDVREYAGHMISDHSLNNEMIITLDEKENIGFKESKKSSSLEEKSLTTKDNLTALTTEELDRTYIENQIATHEKVLKDIKEILIPATKDSKLEKHLNETAVKVREHLNHAKAVEKKLPTHV